MPIFGKKTKDQSGEVTAPGEAPGGDLNERTTPDEEQAVLDQYFDGDLSEPPAADAPPIPAADAPPIPAAPEEEPQNATDEGDADLGDDLMDIFAAEDVEDEDLSALTDGLPDVESESLLTLGRKVLELLKNEAEST